MFGSLLGDFDEDPIFGQHMRQMNNLMGSLMPDPFNMLTPFDNFGPPAIRSPTNGLFGFPGIPNMNRLLSGDLSEGNGGSFCSSSVISMSSGPDGRPQIYQASQSTKTGPGGVRETRKTVQDSRSGLKKMAIGHHIGERAHIIEREQNARSGQHEERQEFINLDEEEAEDFDKEFTHKVRRVDPPLEMIAPAPRSYNQHHNYRQLPALPAPPSTSSSSAANNTSTTTATTSTSPISSTQRRQILSSRNLTQVASRRPLRTPTSSPLASNTTTTTASIHPHPYNTSAARRNFRAKHPQHHQQHQQNQQQQQHQQNQPQDLANVKNFNGCNKNQSPQNPNDNKYKN